MTATTTNPAAAPPNTTATPTDEQLVSLFLREHDAPCPRCGYNLRGLTGATCPECNERVTLTIGNAADRRHLYGALRLLFLWPLCIVGVYVARVLASYAIAWITTPASWGTLYTWLWLIDIVGHAAIALGAVVALVRLRGIRRGHAGMRRPHLWRRAAWILLLMYIALASALWILLILLLL